MTRQLWNPSLPIWKNGKFLSFFFFLFLFRVVGWLFVCFSLWIHSFIVCLCIVVRAVLFPFLVLFFHLLSVSFPSVCAVYHLLIILIPSRHFLSFPLPLLTHLSASHEREKFSIFYLRIPIYGFLGIDVKKTVPRFDIFQCNVQYTCFDY